MTAYRGKRAFLTGAASGIGRALAKRLALEGASLIMADRDQKGLEKTLSDIQALKGEGEIYLLDAADRDAVHDLAQRLCQREGGVDLVISCAGILNAALVEELSYEDLERVMEVNFWGMVYGTKAFLHHLLEKGEGHIVNISSMYGLVGIPSQSAYNASKFAIRGFTDSLRHELRQSGVSVSCVYPGGVLTNLARNIILPQSRDSDAKRREFSEFFDKQFARTSAEKAADVIVRGMKKKKSRIRVGPDAYLMDWLERLFPTGYYQAATALNRRGASAAEKILPTRSQKQKAGKS